MGYEKFTKQRRPDNNQTMITVLKGGQLGISKMCLEEYFKDYKYADMYYDKGQKKIGIRPTNDATSDSCNIRRIKHGTLASISIIEFMKQFDIKHENSISYLAVWNDEEKLVEITLK